MHLRKTLTLPMAGLFLLMLVTFTACIAPIQVPSQADPTATTAESTEATTSSSSVTVIGGDEADLRSFLEQWIVPYYPGAPATQITITVGYLPAVLPVALSLPPTLTVIGAIAVTGDYTSTELLLTAPQDGETTVTTLHRELKAQGFTLPDDTMGAPTRGFQSTDLSLTTLCAPENDISANLSVSEGRAGASNIRLSFDREQLVLVGIGWLAACTPIPTPQPLPAPTEAVIRPLAFDSVAEVQAVTAFPLLVPTTTLSPTLEFVQAYYQANAGQEVVDLRYTLGAAELTLQEVTLPPDHTLLPRQEAHEVVTVRGYTDYQITPPTDPDQHSLLWAEEGRLMSLAGPFEPALLLAIAESLHLFLGSSMQRSPRPTPTIITAATAEREVSPPFYFPQDQTIVTSDTVRIFNTALLEGELVLINNCLGIFDLLNNPAIVIWPPEHTMNENNGRIQILDQKSGTVLAQLGDKIGIGGSYDTVEVARHMAGSTLPQECTPAFTGTDAFIIAAPSLRVTEQHAYALPSPEELTASEPNYSPDWQWRAVVRTNLQADNPMRWFFVALQVTSDDGRTTWTPIAEERAYGLGYSLPAVVQWSQDGQALYYTEGYHPDGCVLFGGGSGLWRLDLPSGEVSEVLSASWELAISPDETLVAYTGAVKDELSLLDLATGEIQGIKLPMLEGNAQFGRIIWSPDSQRLAFTIAYAPCQPPQWRQSIVVVDIRTRTVKTLIEKDERLLTTGQWLDADRILLHDQEGKEWEMDVATGSTATGE